MYSAMYTIAIIAVVTLMTCLTRGLPYLMFGGKRKLPDIISYISKVFPAAIMIILLLYCLRNIKFTIFPLGLPELVSVALVVFIHLWRKNTFLSVIIGTAFYMILIRQI